MIENGRELKKTENRAETSVKAAKVIKKTKLRGHFKGRPVAEIPKYL